MRAQVLSADTVALPPRDTFRCPASRSAQPASAAQVEGVDMVMAAVVMGLAGMDEGSEEVVGREKAPPEEGTQGGSLAERVEA